MDKESLHQTTEVEDKIALIGELEHLRAHAIRAASVSELNSKNADTDEEAERYHGNTVAFLAWAEQAKKLRREFMQKNFPDIPDTLWCMCKSAARLKQITYEITLGDLATLREVDALVDDIWSNATNMDLTSCTSCHQDRVDAESESVVE